MTISAKADRELASPARLLQAALANDLLCFVEFGFNVVRPGVKFRMNWHIDALTNKLAQVATGKIKRLIITIPPRNLKSVCASVALPAWVLGRNPAERIVVVSYSDALARVHSNDFRLLVRHPLYQAAFPRMRLARDTDREIMTTQRGRRLAASLDGTLTGLGGNLIIIDDPIKLGDAYSEAVRLHVLEWYRTTLLTRLDDKRSDRIVVVMQRVHQDDLVGHLIEQGGFELLNLPAIATQDASYELSGGGIYHRRAGEILHPEHEPAEILGHLKRDMGPIAFAAQYQQQPIPPGGTIIKRKWLQTYHVLPRLESRDRIIISWDIALTEKVTGDYSACVVLLQRGETFFVLDVVRGRFRFEELKRQVLSLKARYGSGSLLIEDSPISRGLIQSLREQHVAVVPYRPETDKRARLIAQSDLFAAGAVHLPAKAPWLEEFVAELLAFPGRHDDQVDAIAQGLAWGRQTAARRVYVRPVLGMY